MFQIFHLAIMDGSLPRRWEPFVCHESVGIELQNVGTVNNAQIGALLQRTLDAIEDIQDGSNSQFAVLTQVEVNSSNPAVLFLLEVLCGGRLATIGVDQAISFTAGRLNSSQG